MFEEPTDEGLSPQQQEALWQTVQSKAHPDGTVAFSYCSYESHPAAFTKQAEAVRKVRQSPGSAVPLVAKEFPFVFVPNNLHKSPRPVSMTPLDMCKPLFFAHTDSDVAGFHTHLEYSPDSNWAGNLLQGYSKTGPERAGAVQVQKPVSLAIELILRYTNPHDLVVVPFAGTGSEVLAALYTGRRVVAFEKDTERYLSCRSRVEDLLGKFASETGPKPRFRFPNVRRPYHWLCQQTHVQL